MPVVDPAVPCVHISPEQSDQIVRSSSVRYRRMTGSRASQTKRDISVCADEDASLFLSVEVKFKREIEFLVVVVTEYSERACFAYVDPFDCRPVRSVAVLPHVSKLIRTANLLCLNRLGNRQIEVEVAIARVRYCKRLLLLSAMSHRSFERGRRNLYLRDAGLRQELGNGVHYLHCWLVFGTGSRTTFNCSAGDELKREGEEYQPRAVVPNVS